MEHVNKVAANGSELSTVGIPITDGEYLIRPLGYLKNHLRRVSIQAHSLSQMDVGKTDTSYCWPVD